MKEFKINIILLGILLLTACTPSTLQATMTPTSLPTDTATLLPTATSTPQPSPTPDRFSAEALAFIPHTIDEIGQSVEVRSPIDDPEGYKEDINKAINVIDQQILPGYTGKIIQGGKTGAGIDPERGALFFIGSDVLNPVASVYFNWEGNKVPILYLPCEDSQGRFSMGIVISPNIERINANEYTNPGVIIDLDEMLKRFPLEIGKGELETRYTNNGPYSTVLTSLDPFYAAYFSQHEDPTYMLALWKYFLGEHGVHSDLDRKYESSPLVVLGLTW